MTGTADTLVIGAGPAGLAVGAVLRRANLPFTILERSSQVGASWRRHYESIHLHTAKGFSALPFHPYPREYPRYPSRLQFIEYLEGYARQFDLTPEFGVEVEKIRGTGNGGWETSTTAGRYDSQRVVVATGAYDVPRLPGFPGQQSFPGRILHSAEYVNGAAFRGQRVLVVGFGSSGGEIAVDLCRQGAHVSLSLRSPVTVVPRQVLGIPNTAFAIACRPLPPKIADLLNAPTIRLTIGDLSRYGIRKRKDGPFTEMYKEFHVPVVDVGIIDLVKRGVVVARPAIQRIEGGQVVFGGGETDTFDSIILATGYESGLRRLFDEESPALNPAGYPAASGGRPPVPGLYFCGFYNVPTGLLREIGIEAKRIGAAIERARRKHDAAA